MNDSPVNLTASQKIEGETSKYTAELAAEICRQLALGESLRTICKKHGMPGRHAVLRWLHENSDFRSQYTLARDDMVDALAEEAMHLAKTATEKNANARRLYVDTVKWYVGKVAPKKYGDKGGAGGASRVRDT